MSANESECFILKIKINYDSFFHRLSPVVTGTAAELFSVKCTTFTLSRIFRHPHDGRLFTLFSENECAYDAFTLQMPRDDFNFLTYVYVLLRLLSMMMNFLEHKTVVWNWHVSQTSTHSLRSYPTVSSNFKQRISGWKFTRPKKCVRVIKRFFHDECVETFFYVEINHEKFIHLKSLAQVVVAVVIKIFEFSICFSKNRKKLFTHLLCVRGDD